MKRILALILALMIAFCSALPAFAGTEGIAYAISEGGASVTGYNGTQKEVEIDEVYNGVPVVAIADEAFKESFVSSVVLPKSVTSIGERAFSGCTKINYVRVPSSVKYIGKDAFACGSPSFVLRCNKGSYAEAYAEDYSLNVNYVLSSPVLKAQARTNNEIHLWWSSVQGADEYFIYRVLANGSRALLDSTEDTVFDVKNLSGNTEYTFFVRAVDDKKTASSDYEKKASATVLTLCDNPEVRIKSSPHRLDLHWQNVDGAKRYNVYLVKGAKPVKLIKSTTKNGFVYDNLPVGKTFAFFVSIVDLAGNESRFEKKNVIIASTVCEKPKTQAAGSWISIDVNWEGVEGAEYYGVFYSSSMSGGYQLADYVYPKGDSKKFEYTIGGKLNYMKDYKVLVRAYNENDDGSPFDKTTGIKCRLKGFYIISAALILLAIGVVTLIVLFVIKKKKEYYEVEC